MDQNIDRREFVKRCVASSVGLIAGSQLSEAMSIMSPSPPFELCAVRGSQFAESTHTAIDTLGGIGKFVRPGSSVGILINSHFSRVGTCTNPDIALAVVRMCLDAGATSIHALNDISPDYWKRARQYESMKGALDGIRYASEKSEVAIAGGIQLKTAEISTALLACDVFINMPIIKDHEGTRFTCNLKNVMGACSRSTCRRFHYGDSSLLSSLLQGAYSNLELLAQSIADVNLVRRPHLSVVDATQILATNGPSGPGEIRRPQEVIASTNCVAADMYAVRHLGLKWEDLPVIKCAQQHGYGPESLEQGRVQIL